jgi:hypothetical protein
MADLASRRPVSQPIAKGYHMGNWVSLKISGNLAAAANGV